MNIIVVFPKIDDAKSIRNLLVRHGFTVTAVCTSGTQVLNCVDSMDTGLVVCGYRFTDMVYAQLKSNLPEGFEMLLLASRRVLSEVEISDVMCVSMPLKVHELIDTINMIQYSAMKRRRKRREKPRVRDPKERAIIEKAKMLLMERNNMTEEEAHRYVQKCSMDSGNSMVETAQMIMSIMEG